MDFVRSNFCTNEPLPVEHFFPHFLAGLFTANRPKSVQLAEVHLYRNYFLQNPYFSGILEVVEQYDYCHELNFSNPNLEVASSANLYLNNRLV